jgi:hypothetical protein
VLSTAAAEALARHRGELSLRGLGTLSVDAAQALARHEGELSLPDLTTLPAEAVRALRSNGAIRLPDELPD